MTQTFLSKAAQNLIVLAREEAGAEKIFQSDGVQLLMQLLDTAQPDLMLAALRTLVGLCSGHRSRVGVSITQLLWQGLALGSCCQGDCGASNGTVGSFCLWPALAWVSRGVVTC